MLTLTKVMKVLLIGALFWPVTAWPERVCGRIVAAKGGGSKLSVKTVTGRCPSGFVLIVDTGSLTGPQGAQGEQGAQGPQGAQGVQGPQGSSGSLRIYGNGSAGALLINNNNYTDGSTLLDAAQGNLQFTDLTVQAGNTLEVDSGTVIRCTGTFTNRGTITVRTGARGPSVFSLSTNPVIYPFTPGGPANCEAQAQVGEQTVSSIIAFRGLGAIAFQLDAGRNLLQPGAFGGCGGAGIRNFGSRGGGSLVVLAQGGIVNDNGAFILADGETPTAGNNGAAGGGGGGIVIMASPASIVNNGLISVKGGNGTAANGYVGAGGPGGGGIVHLISPVITNSEINVALDTGAGGAGGAVANEPGCVVGAGVSCHWGGPGGGGLGGDGGQGGTVDTSGVSTAGSGGNSGKLYTELIDPTSLF